MRKFLNKSSWLKSFESDPLWEDSKELNTVAQNANIKINWLETRWNMKNDPDAYFTHLWGNQKKYFPICQQLLKQEKLLASLI